MEKYFNDINEEMLRLWYSMDTTYKGYKKRYKRNNDRALLLLNKQIKRGLRHIDVNDLESSEGQILLDHVKSFANQIVGMSDHAVEEIFKKDYFEYSQTFIKKARALEPTLDKESIFQALRNVWVMHSMQMYLGKDVALTDAVFAYSMLYPLTDNYLDDPKITKEEKIDFSLRFREKIASGQGVAKNATEEKAFKMIDLIESNWCRKEYPQVFESLIAILDGQSGSLYQHEMDSLFDKDLLALTFYKGGSSVLADAYLIAGYLTKDQIYFAFMYGVILQLADDIQDIDSDLKQNHFTVMNVQGTLGLLDTMLHKLLNFIDYFGEQYYEQTTNAQVALKELTMESIQLLLFEALMKSRRYISKEVYKHVCKSSYFSSKTYKKVEKSLNRELNNMVKAL